MADEDALTDEATVIHDSSSPSFSKKLESSSDSSAKSLESISLLQRLRNDRNGKIQSLPGSIEEEEEQEEVKDIIIKNDEDQRSFSLHTRKPWGKKQKTWGLSRSFDTYQLDDLNLIDEDQILADEGETTFLEDVDGQQYEKPLANGHLLQNTLDLTPIDNDLERKSSDISIIDYKPFTKSEMSLFDKYDSNLRHSAKFDPHFPHHTKTSLMRLRIGELAHRKAVEEDIQFRVERTRTEYRRFDYRSVPLSPKIIDSGPSRSHGLLKRALSEVTIGSKLEELDHKETGTTKKMANGVLPKGKKKKPKKAKMEAQKKDTGNLKSKSLVHPKPKENSESENRKRSEPIKPKKVRDQNVPKPRLQGEKDQGAVKNDKIVRRSNGHTGRPIEKNHDHQKTSTKSHRSRSQESKERPREAESHDDSVPEKKDSSQMKHLKSLFVKKLDSPTFLGKKSIVKVPPDSPLTKKLFNSPRRFFTKLADKLNNNPTIISDQDDQIAGTSGDDGAETSGSTGAKKELLGSFFGGNIEQKLEGQNKTIKNEAGQSLLASTISKAFGMRDDKEVKEEKMTDQEALELKVIEKLEQRQTAGDDDGTPKSPSTPPAASANSDLLEPTNDVARKPSLAPSSMNSLEGEEEMDDAGAKVQLDIERIKRDPSTKLIKLCKNGQWSKVDALLDYINEQKLNLSLTDEDGMTPLMFAVKDDKLAITQRLLGLGSDLEEKTKDYRSLSHIAAMYSKEDVVAFLIEKKVNNWREPFGPNQQLPIHMAVVRSSPHAHDVVCLILKAYPECRYIQDGNGATPLLLASEKGNVQICRELLQVQPERQIKVKRKDNGDGVLHAAVKSRNPELLKLLCENGALVNIQNDAGQTPIFLAVASNSESMLKILYQYKADANIADNEDKSPLHIAAEKGYTNMVELLADKFKASVYARTKDGSTLMHIASKFGHSDTALAFLKRGVPLYMPNKSGALGLHLAATLGHIDVVRALLNKGTPVDSKTKDNYTALHVAVQAEKYEVVEILLGHGADVSIKGGPLAETALHVAAGIDNYGGLRCAEMLLKSGADVNSKLENGQTALHIASKTGDVKMIKLLLSEGAEPLATSVHGETPLHVTARFCHFEAAKTLLEHIENNRRREDCTQLVNRQTTSGETPMHLCAESSAKTKSDTGEDVDLINLLLDYGGEINVQTITAGETVLHYCARSGNEEVMKTIVRKIQPGAIQIALNRQSKAGWSPLMEASEKGHLVVTRILLEHHARVDVFDEAGKTALHLSAEHGHVEICDLLIKSKAFINSKTRAGFTPLHLAAINGYRKVVTLLVQVHKAFVDAVNNEGYTPMHLAAQAGQLQVCTTLLSLGANPNAHEGRGRTPFHLAAESDHPEIVKLFLKLKPDLTTLTATDENGLTCAHIAAMKGSVAVIKELMMIDRKVVIEAKTKAREATTLHMAAEGGFKNVVKILLAAGADPLQEDDNGMTPLQLAAKNGHTTLLDVFEEDVWRKCSRKTGMSAMHVASYYGQMEFVRALLFNVPPTIRSEPPINNDKPLMSREFANEYGFTPLHMAAQSGHEGLVRLLLNFSLVQVDAATTLMSIIPLHLAAQSGHVAVVGMLLSRSTQQLHIKDSRSRTALHLASSNGHLEMVSLLLAQGSNVNVLDQNGWTALHHATSAGHAQVVKLLIESNADPFAETREGKVALCFAAARGHINVLVYLMQQPHDTVALMDDRKFVYDLMLCGKNYNNRSVEEFVLLSPAPMETAVKLSSLYKYLASNEKERSRDLYNIAEYCENLAVELLSLAAANHNPAVLLKAVDSRGRPFIDVLIENEQKAVVSHVSVQRYLSEVWGGGIRWGFGKFALFFAILFFCPPAWIFFSLPFAFRISKAPIIKFVCHLVSHIYFTILLILETLCVVRPIYEIDSFWPLINEWILLLWLSGILVSELSRLGGRSGLAYVRLVEILLGSVAVLLHLCAFAVPPTTGLPDDEQLKLQQTLLYMRNQLFSITLLFGFTQYLEFLTVHHLFGPWAIIIRDLMYDLTRFLVILFLFMSGFTISISAIFQPAFSPIGDDQSKELMKLTSLTQTIQMLYFSLFGLVDPTNMPPLHLVPDLGQTLLKFIFGIYLLVVIIVLINLLIAMMSDTYQRIQAQSDIEWKFGRAKLIREMNKKSATPVPINMFTKLVTVLRVAVSNRGRMCTSKAQDDLRQLEDIDAYSMSEQAGRISPTLKMIYSKPDDNFGRQSIAPETGLPSSQSKSWKIEKVINWKSIIGQYRQANGGDDEESKDKAGLDDHDH